MQEMLEYIVKNLVSNPDAVEISAENQITNQKKRLGKKS